MGVNGSHASGILYTEAGRKYYTLFSMGENIKVLGQKNPKQSGKLPEESRTPNRIYVSFYKNGKDVKEIAQYGPDGKKIFSIHTDDHHGIKPHYHIWKDGAQLKPGYKLDSAKLDLLTKIQNYGTK